MMAVADIKVGGDVARQATARVEPNPVAAQIHERHDAAFENDIVNGFAGRAGR